MTAPVFDGLLVHVMAERCSTCIFRPGNLMNLRAGRLRDMTADPDSHVICHKTLDRKVGAICRGSYDRGQSDLLQIAEQLGCVVFDGAEDL